VCVCVCVCASSVCGGYYRFFERGVIRSPSHPNNYPDNSNCTWTIQGQSGRVFRVNFTAFSIRGTAGSCSDDYVEVRTSFAHEYFTLVLRLVVGSAVAEWLACWTQVQKVLG